MTNFILPKYRNQRQITVMRNRCTFDIRRQVFSSAEFVLLGEDKIKDEW